MSYNPQSGNILVWVALIISIIALILAWVAFNRTGTDVEMLVEEEISEAIADLRVELNLNGTVDQEQTTPDNIDGTDTQVEEE